MKGGEERRQSAAGSHGSGPAPSAAKPRPGFSFGLSRAYPTFVISIVRVAAVLAIAGYLVALHYVTTDGTWPLLALVLATAPLLIVVDLNIARTRGAAWAALFAIVSCALFWALRGMLEREASRIFLAQHVGVNLFLCWLFGHTLSGGKEALVTQFARAVHGNAISDARVAYTRRVTLVWALFFLVVALVSLALYVFAPLSAWSMFANVLNLPLAVAVFVGEYVYRLHHLGRSDDKSILDGFRAFRNHRSRADLVHGSSDEP